MHGGSRWAGLELCVKSPLPAKSTSWAICLSVRQVGRCCSICIREKTIGASYGDAFLAAVAVGDVQRGDITLWNPVANEIRPDQATQALYRQRYEVFRELYPRTRDLMRRLEA